MGDWMFRHGFAFLIQLITCESIFVLKFKRKKLFLLRLLFSLAVIFASSYGMTALMHVLPIERWIFQIPSFTISASLTVAAMYFCFEVKLFSAMFAGIGGYALQHLTYGVATIIRYLIGSWSKHYIINQVLYYVPFIVFAGLLYFIFIRRNKNFHDYQNNSDKRSVLLALVFLFVSIVLSIISGLGGNGNQFVSVIVCRLYSIACCILVLVVLFGFFRQNKLQRENEIMDRLLDQGKLQQKMTKENIDIINVKCHDLKNQISMLKTIDNPAERTATIEEIEKAIMIYDSVAKTGNEPLDIVLTEKKLQCEKHNIRFDYMLDGAEFEFMSSADIFSLFYNAVDNAIQSASEEPDEEKRIISLRASRRDGSLYVHMENYCAAELVFEDGLPVTTKSDKRYHGFGIKSIRHIVQKYGGSMSIEVKNNFFNLDMLFPVK